MGPLIKKRLFELGLRSRAMPKKPQKIYKQSQNSKKRFLISGPTGLIYQLEKKLNFKNLKNLGLVRDSVSKFSENRELRYLRLCVILEVFRTSDPHSNSNLAETWL